MFSAWREYCIVGISIVRSLAEHWSNLHTLFFSTWLERQAKAVWSMFHTWYGDWTTASYQCGVLDQCPCSWSDRTFTQDRLDHCSQMNLKFEPQLLPVWLGQLNHRKLWWSQTWFEHLRAEPRTGIEAADDFATMLLSNQISPHPRMNVPEIVGQRIMDQEEKFCEDQTDPFVAWRILAFLVGNFNAPQPCKYLGNTPCRCACLNWAR